MKLGPYIAAIVASFLFGVLLEMITFGISQLKSKIDENTMLVVVDDNSDITNSPQSNVKTGKVSTLSQKNGEINQTNSVAEPHFSGTSFVKQSIGTEKKGIRFDLRLCIAFGYLLQLALAYTIMMIVMTYNVLLFIAPVLGMTLGYIIILYVQSVMNPPHRSESYSILKE